MGSSAVHVAWSLSLLYSMVSKHREAAMFGPSSRNTTRVRPTAETSSLADSYPHCFIPKVVRLDG